MHRPVYNPPPEAQINTEAALTRATTESEMVQYTSRSSPRD